MPSLPAIAALVRAGAVEQAWAAFHAAGFDRSANDPAALAVLGRLHKARARLASGGEASTLFALAARAYAEANALAPATYLAINAASLHELAGSRAAAQAGARQVLAMLDTPGGAGDTPYYLAATRAEALLLLSDVDGAAQAMAEAVRLDPDGWTDRATTIAQFEELLAAMDSDAEWLDRFRPPATLHFAGHMALEPGGAGERALAARVDALLAEHSIGFAFGAAASGCDVVIGERVLARGGELALVLPSPQDHFERQSVAPAGEAWVERYRALLDRATSVVAVGDGRETLHDPLATYLAGQVALGDALTKASTLSSHAHQLIVLDNDGGGPHSRALAAAWPLRERAHLLALDRESDVAALFAPDADDPARRLAFPLAIRLNMRGGDSAAIARQREPVWRALAAVSSTAVRAVPEGWDVLAESAGEAARLAQEIMSACAAGPGRMPSIGLSAGIVLAIDDRAAGHVVPIGPAVAQAGRMAQIAPGGAILASQHFAAVLAASGETALRSEYYHGGEGGPADGVYLIVPRG